MNELQISNQKIQRNLSALAEFSRVVNSSLDLTFTLNNLLFSCMGKFLTTKGIVILLSNQKYEIALAKGVAEDIIKSFPNVSKDDGQIKSVVEKYCSENNFLVLQEIETSRGKLGYLLLGEKITKQKYSEDEIDFLKTIVNIASTAIENSLIVNELKAVNRTLDQKVNSLNSLLELSKEFGALTEEQRVSKLLTFTLLGHFMISLYAVVIVEGRTCRILESTISKKNLSDVLKDCDLLSINKICNEEEIKSKSEALFNFGFVLLIPMVMQGETKGILLIGRRMTKQPYSTTDIEFIESVANLAIISIENKRLFKEALEKQKLEEELELAKDIQQNLLPKKLPQLDKIEVSAFSIASRQVGGDYYDLINLNQNSFCTAIADVSGKGIPASLLMANLQAFLKSITKQGMNISEATGLINDLVTDNTSDGRFITFFWGVIDSASMNISYVNAGHNPPIFVRDNKIKYLDKGGMLLGVLKTILPYEMEIINLQKGDLIVLFTDGVTEAKNKNDDEFTDAKLEKIILDNSHLSAVEIIDVIKKEIENFTLGYPQSDDITIVAIKVIN